MSRILRNVHSNLIWIGAVCAMASCARPTATPPPIVLEATNAHSGMGYEEKSLLVRLTEDGKIEWDQWKAPRVVYVDTSDELHVRMMTKTGPVEFSLVNPWSSGMPRKPMPADVRLVFRETDALYTQNAKYAVDQMCKTNDSSR